MFPRPRHQHLVGRWVSGVTEDKVPAEQFFAESVEPGCSPGPAIIYATGQTPAHRDELVVRRADGLHGDRKAAEQAGESKSVTTITGIHNL